MGEGGKEKMIKFLLLILFSTLGAQDLEKYGQYLQTQVSPYEKQFESSVGKTVTLNDTSRWETLNSTSCWQNGDRVELQVEENLYLFNVENGEKVQVKLVEYVGEPLDALDFKFNVWDSKTLQKWSSDQSEIYIIKSFGNEKEYILMTKEKVYIKASYPLN